ncbi:TrkH family potassium uptake protein [uncultured Shewanella sp.]|uniref:TrkH family potassium uptake protein n=1 Tax=uncultured Shewanella sp. TaxID=173975 RepID=UPI00261EAE30|nr:TrkH family potassium uptake protein [uncultured Shewanella sp.]
MLNFRALLFILGTFLAALTGFMLIPLCLAIYLGESTIGAFARSCIYCGIAAAMCLHNGQKKRLQLNIRDMFILTSFTWMIVSLFAALPFTIYIDINYTDAFFETMSGITTTGSTVLSGLDDMDRSILIWRSLLHWFGGIGFIVMAVAILPFLNVGGMRLFRTESSDWSDKTVPRTQLMAKNLLFVYCSLTLLCYVAYHYSGMSWFDAINHAMSTLSTGGFSTSDKSMAAFSHEAQWFAVLFMISGSLPLLLFVYSLQQSSLKVWNDSQVKGFLLFLLIVSVALSIWLAIARDMPYLDALRLSTFNVVSVVSTTGFGLTDYDSWGTLASITFFFLLFVGGCSGSTSGGIKIFRFQIAFAVMVQQLKQQFHPKSVFKSRYNDRIINPEIVDSLVTFMLLFIMTFVIITVILVATGLDLMTSISGSITAISNVGPGIGNEIGPSSNFASVPDVAKWALAIGMLMGRLEILTVAVLFHHKFWRF